MMKLVSHKGGHPSKANLTPQIPTFYFTFGLCMKEIDVFNHIIDLVSIAGDAIKRI